MKAKKYQRNNEDRTSLKRKKTLKRLEQKWIGKREGKRECKT